MFWLANPDASTVGETKRLAVQLQSGSDCIARGRTTNALPDRPLRKNNSLILNVEGELHARAALGLSVILATSAVAFTIVKLVGAAYLIYLGTRLLLSKTAGNNGAPSTAAVSAGSRSAFAQGILTNVLNPKVALFFLALLPQFIESASPTKTLAFLALGGTFITTGLIWCLVLATAVARLQAFFLRNPSNAHATRVSTPSIMGRGSPAKHRIDPWCPCQRPKELARERTHTGLF